jgi:hypothetical protein
MLEGVCACISGSIWLACGIVVPDADPLKLVAGVGEYPVADMVDLHDPAAGLLPTEDMELVRVGVRGAVSSGVPDLLLQESLEELGLVLLAASPVSSAAAEVGRSEAAPLDVPV